MVEQFFLSIQQNFKLFLWAPILSAIFRLIFMRVYNPYPTWKDKWPIVRESFRYGFWWGLDFHAYVFLVPLIVVTLPGLLFPSWEAMGDTIRLILATIYSLVVYAAFAGKMIFYRHFHDTYNYMVHYGHNAEKGNLVDIFFNQDKGALVILGFIPVGCISWFAMKAFLGLPSISAPTISSPIISIVACIILFIASVLLFYWLRYGGTLNHRNKPEWDVVPSIVKEDPFFAKATIDDLIALENVLKHPLREDFNKSEEELLDGIEHIIPENHKKDWRQLENPLFAFKWIAQGPRMEKPKHIFFIVGESVPQFVLDPIYENINICQGLRNFQADPHTAQIKNFLPSGNVSRPSIVSLVSGIFDAGMELNEHEAFWHKTFPTAMAEQIKKLGYQTIFWYGGNATAGQYDKFGHAQGFDRVESATSFCGPNAPQTWLGVYDHVFMDTLGDLIEDIDVPSFHFIYTTTNHGPFTLPADLIGFDPDDMLPGIGEDIKRKKNKDSIKSLGTFRYCDKAIFDFVDRMKAKYPDSLFVVTGDHSNLVGLFSNSSITPRDYALREKFNTVCLMQGPSFTKESFAATIGTHMNLMPTIIESIAPQGFEYYSIASSLFEKQPDVLVTPYQWITDQQIGHVDEDYAEDNYLQRDSIKQYRPVNNHKEDANYWTYLSTWFIKQAENNKNK